MQFYVREIEFARLAQIGVNRQFPFRPLLIESNSSDRRVATCLKCSIDLSGQNNGGSRLPSQPRLIKEPR
jgi:hypothetical protein